MPKAAEQPPSTTKPVIMIHGSRASGAASPLICTSVAEWPVCSSDAATQAAVNATGPAIPAAAPSLVPVPRVAGLGGSSLRRVRMIIAGSPPTTVSALLPVGGPTAARRRRGGSTGPRCEPVGEYHGDAGPGVLPGMARSRAGAAAGHG